MSHVSCEEEKQIFYSETSSVVSSSKQSISSKNSKSTQKMARRYAKKYNIQEDEPMEIVNEEPSSKDNTKKVVHFGDPT